MLSLMASADTVEVIAMEPPVTVLPIVPPLSVVHCRDLSVCIYRITILLLRRTVLQSISTDSETQNRSV